MGEYPRRQILVEPPRVIAPDQRIKYGAIAATVRMAEVAFADLYAEAAKYAEVAAIENRDQLEARMRCLNLAWSIVDQADLLRQLITSEGRAIQLKEAHDFLSEAEKVREVRNWMRHLPQRVAAYLKRKEALPPALGALSFTVLKRVRPGLQISGTINDADVIEYQTFVLPSAAFERGAKLEGVPEPYTVFKCPVDHFYLQAFGYHLNLERIVQAMTAFCDSLAEGVVHFLEGKIAELKVTGEYHPDLEKIALEHGWLYTMVAKRD